MENGPAGSRPVPGYWGTEDYFFGGVVAVVDDVVEEVEEDDFGCVAGADAVVEADADVV